MVVSFRGDHRDQESDEVPKKNINGGDSSSSIDGGSVSDTKQERVETANQKHALSERERRKRINSHYDSLRQLFPGLIKTDKASVLTETVQHLKKLKNMVEYIMTPHDDDKDGCSMGQKNCVPSEKEEVSISYYNNGDKTSVRATISCEDRPNLNQDLMKAIQWAHGKAVMAEMATVGRRTKVDMVVEWRRCRNIEEDVGLLTRALKAVVEDQILGRAKFMGRGSTEPEFVELGRRLADSVRPNVCDQTKNEYL